MRCNEIMESNVKAARPNDSLQQVARVMREEDVGFLPVCDARGEVVGTLTDRDIVVRAIAEGRGLETVAADVMTTDVVAVSPESDVERAQQLMRERKISRIVCLDNQRHLVGVIALSDLSREGAAAQTLQSIKEAPAAAH